MRLAFCLVLIFSTTALSKEKCKLAESPTVVDKKSQLDEASGIDHGLGLDVLWAHNDSGGAPEIFGIADNSLKYTVKITGAKAQDWEDIATGKCYRGNCIFIGDIGNNGGGRKTLQLYVATEPKDLTKLSAIDADSFSFHYPDKGGYNSEALAWDETGQRLYLIQKGGSAGFYIFPEKLHDGMTLEKLCDFKAIPGVVTGADISKDGKKLLVRTYQAVMEYKLQGAKTCASEPLWSINHREKQGEAVAYTQQGFITVSEGLSPNLNSFDCGFGEKVNEEPAPKHQGLDDPYCGYWIEVLGFTCAHPTLTEKCLDSCSRR
jgi:hypothetical protein